MANNNNNNVDDERAAAAAALVDDGRPNAFFEVSFNLPAAQVRGVCVCFFSPSLTRLSD